MGLLDKVKGMVGGNKKAVKTGIDKAADVVESKTPDSVDTKIEAGAEKAKEIIDKLPGDKS